MDFHELYDTKKCGGGVDFGMTIAAALGVPVTDEHRNAARRAGEKLEDELMRITVKDDPVRKERAAKERADLLACFDGTIHVKEIPNGYCSRWCCSHLPWFVVTTSSGPITIGWRKRVIQIDYSGTDVLHDAAALFPGENVTRDGQMIHAYGYDKARAYLRIIKEHSRNGV